jgi:hypothetical protein
LEATYQTIRSFNSNEAETHSTPERDETRNEQILLANRLSQGNSSLVPELSLRQKIQSSQNIPLVSFESLPNVFKFYKSGELFELSKVVFCSPCSQSELEQQFSSVAHTVTPYRTRLGPTVLNDILCCRLNQSLLSHVKY